MEAGSVESSHNFADAELEVLAYWDKIDAFKTSLKLSEGKKEYSFYDGPPFATGLPHYGESMQLCRGHHPLLMQEPIPALQGHSLGDNR